MKAGRRPTDLGDVDSLVTRVFSNIDDPEFIRDYIGELRQNWREVNISQGRITNLMLLTAALFHLLTRAAIQKVSFGGFEISDLSLVRIALPVILAYLFFEFNNLEAFGTALEEAHRAIIRIKHPQVTNNNLDAWLRPRWSVLLGPWVVDVLAKSGRAQVRNNVTVAMGAALYFGVIYFECYAYFVQLTSIQADTALVLATIPITFAFISLGTSLIIAGFPSRKRVITRLDPGA